MLQEKVTGVTSNVQKIKNGALYSDCKFHDHFVPSSQTTIKRKSTFRFKGQINCNMYNPNKPIKLEQ
jgi:hypothetical protein